MNCVNVLEHENDISEFLVELFQIQGQGKMIRSSHLMGYRPSVTDLEFGNMDTGTKGKTNHPGLRIDLHFLPAPVIITEAEYQVFTDQYLGSQGNMPHKAIGENIKFAFLDCFSGKFIH